MRRGLLDGRVLCQELGRPLDVYGAGGAWVACDEQYHTRIRARTRTRTRTAAAPRPDSTVGQRLVGRV